MRRISFQKYKNDKSVIHQNMLACVEAMPEQRKDPGNATENEEKEREKV